MTTNKWPKYLLTADKCAKKLLTTDNEDKQNY